jgi:membrane protease YdiL (CAAX protease family)
MTKKPAATAFPIGKQAELSGDCFSALLRGVGPIGILAMLVILAGNLIIAPLGAGLVLLWARLSGTPWRDLGFVQPKSWIRILFVGSLFGIALKVLMKAVVMPLLGAPAINQAYHYLAGNTAALPGTIITMIIVAGFGEETVFGGYLFERFGKVFGTGIGARFITVLLTSAWFAIMHYHEQGVPGVEQAAITGLVFATMFALTHRLWMPIVAHAAFDLTAVAMIYWDIESKVAHLLFK